MPEGAARLNELDIIICVYDLPISQRDRSCSIPDDLEMAKTMPSTHPDTFGTDLLVSKHAAAGCFGLGQADSFQ
jgi:hypothetical protein